MSKTKLPPPPDLEQRELILNALDRTMLVEAAAGTGKTTSMVGRMTALLRTGVCKAARHLAAVTFTRKAAAELRARFQIRLEKAVRESDGEERVRLQDALDHVDQCFIGTIHSFCGRLLRERPVEAGVDLAFEEIDDDVDAQFREEAWELAMARFVAGEENELVEELNRLGLRPGELKAAFLSFAQYPDVDEWPTAEGPLQLPDLEGPRREMEQYVAHMRSLFSRLPDEWGSDNLIPRYRRLPRILAHYADLTDPVQFMDALSHFDNTGSQTQKSWTQDNRFTKEEAKAEKARWDAFRKGVVTPLRKCWLAMRYEPALRIPMKAREIYDAIREERGALNFQDLLMKAAGLLRSSREARAYFAKRFTHLLVDEFQDTDPIQAEVMMLLSSRDVDESRWRRCRPRPGSLFVVGDPKQSIYRFRRADIVTYNEVKDIIRSHSDGLVVELSTNFRTTGDVIDWVNDVFQPADEDKPKGGAMLRFPKEASDQSPSYVALQKGRLDGSLGELSGVRLLQIPTELSQKARVVDYEADLIARTIRRALDEKWPVARTEPQLADGLSAPTAIASDFMIVTRNTLQMSVYARKLQQYGVPHQVTGGAALNETRELRLLLYALKAIVHPDDPVALVAALRSELFGVSDATLYAFKKSGGRFDYRRPLSEGLPDEHTASVRDAFDLLTRGRRWLTRMPAPAAIERLVRALGLPALAASRPGGDVQAGGLAKGMELLRQRHREAWTTAQLVERLEEIVNMEKKYDGVSARSDEEPAVRVMNLHKVKGLEAPIVFLADTNGESAHPPEFRIDRSGDTAVGYIAILSERKQFQRETLAAPPDWDALSEQEGAFLAAEELRLRYVAATRAGSAMIVSQRSKGNGSNPWQYFSPFLDEAAALPDPGPRTAPAGEASRIDPSAFARATERAHAGLRRIETPTFGARPAKEFALSQGNAGSGAESPELVMDALRGGEGEHGMEWGEVIHHLLELALLCPQADLVESARAELKERGLDDKLADRAADVTQAVMKSDIWRRAVAAPRRFTEAPFQILRQVDGIPTVLRGSIDLVFREEKGWTLIDYKTDRVKGDQLKAAADRYAAQVRLYAEAWEACSGEKVTEAGVLFLAPGLYTKVSR